MDTIFDPLRKIDVARTPEEEVRQSVISWLNAEKGIPLVMMASEYAFQYNSMTYRADIVVFGRDMRPLMMVECKAPCQYVFLREDRRRTRIQIFKRDTGYSDLRYDTGHF